MKLPTKRIAALSAATVIGIGLAGCSAGADGGGTDNPEDITLTWWATQQSSSIESSQAAWQEVGDRFTEETGIEVEVEVIPWADLYNKILAAVSSGTGPDVLNIGTTWTSSLQDTGAFSPASGDNLEAMGGNERFVESAWEAAHVPDTDQTAVPILSAVYSMYYNTALFEAAGISEPPTTWDEFVEVGKELTVDTDGDGQIDQWGFTMPAASTVVDSHQAFTTGQQEGGSFVDEEGNATLSSPAQVDGVTRYVELMTSDQIWSPSDAEVDAIADSTDQLIDGKAAMIWHTNPLAQFESRGFADWAIAELPVPDGAENVQSLVGGTNMVVFDESPNKEAAFEFVGWVTSPEEQSFIADTFSVLPVVTDAYDLDPLASNGDTTVPVRQGILADASAPFPLVANIGEIEPAVGNALREMFQAYATGGDPDIEGRLKAADDQLKG
jgi:multiple sugar transport system substrate-binding protein